MRTFRRFALFACAMLAAAGVLASKVEARQGFGGFFFPFFAPPSYYEPPPWRQRYYGPSRKRYHATPRERKAARTVQRKLVQTRRKRQTALAAIPKKAVLVRQSIAAPKRPAPTPVAVPKEATAFQQAITCEKAQVVVAEYGFKNIKAEFCVGNYLGFNATRDGKPFWVQILASNGELARVQRLR
jgi:hypothetical protein